MSPKTRLLIAATSFLCGTAPSLSQSQSLGDLLKLVSNGNSAKDLVDAIKSLSEATVGRVEPGTAPENIEGKVLLYRTASCPYCKRAASYMREQNIGFVERDIERNPNYKAEFRRLGARGVPLIVFGEKTMSGFDEAKFEQNYAQFKLAKNSPPAVATAVPPPASVNPTIQSGDVLLGKIPGVVVYSRPAKSEKMAVLSKSDEVIFMGDESGGYYRVTTQKGEGWIDKLLVKKQ